jgi:predicted XRE-type DNA-binding protein
MSDTETKTEKPAKAKATNGATLTPDENEMAMALSLFRSIPQDERKEYLIEAQMSHLGRQAFNFLADGYLKLTGEKLSQFIILDGETGIFEDAEFEDDEDGDEDAIDATDGEDEDEEEDEEPEYTALQAVRMLRKWMKDGEYSQAYVAGKLKVSQPCVSTWLKKTSLPREGTIPRIVRLCSK